MVGATCFAMGERGGEGAHEDAKARREERGEGGRGRGVDGEEGRERCEEGERGHTKTRRREGKKEGRGEEGEG
ncbi:MAG: hypothetical protein RIS92_1731, partial [Verrucomicrobiota bacterium]